MSWPARRLRPVSGYFEGSCIDGPRRGQQIKQSGPRFYAPLPVGTYRVGPMTFPESNDAITVENVEYRWSYSLAQWCVVN